MEKGPDAFRTISEVAEDLDLPQHVLRFWETRFGQIKPLKRGGGRRYYRPDDVDLLRGIRHLLYGEGYTIRGVQQILREQGVRHVQAIGHSAESEEARGEAALVDSGHAAIGRKRQEGGIGGLMDLLPSLRSRKEPPELPRVVEVPLPARPQPAAPGADELPPFLRRGGGKASARPGVEDDVPARTAANAPAGKLAPEAARLLKATLNELGECRRMLDAAREREW
ncbi:MAG TPA: MerR family transcriptional regulator [Xanthobacteraceae bacterium]|nr:MerR family transcriptional regulator [Xanthobacteraceae bacterium]